MKLTKKIQKKPTPLENEEAEVFADMLRLKKYNFTHIVNESQTSNPGAWNRVMRLGKSKGFPDYAIIKGETLIFVELKRKIKALSKTSPEQKVWIDELNKCREVKAGVCYGADEAIEFVKEVK